jgi:Protein of unknown function (DUF2793)
MPDPVALPSLTPRYALPVLYAGQAQKEAFVNESLCRIDLALHPVVLGQQATPPAAPVDGQCWIVGPGATGDWAGRENALAGWSAGRWHFIAPSMGMRVWNAATQCTLTFTGAWASQPAPALPSGGTVVDVEARSAIDALIARLSAAGLLAES